MTDEEKVKAVTLALAGLQKGTRVKHYQVAHYVGTIADVWRDKSGVARYDVAYDHANGVTLGYLAHELIPL